MTASSDTSKTTKTEKTTNATISSKNNRLRVLLFLIIAVGVASLVNFTLLQTYFKPKIMPASVILEDTQPFRELRTIAKENPKNSEVQLALGQEFLRQGHYLSACEAFDDAEKAGADVWKVRSGRAQANIKVERYLRADQDLVELIKLRPDILETYLSLAEVRLRADERAEAFKILESYPRDNKKMPMPSDKLTNMEVAELLATSYSHLDRWDKTKELIELCLKQDPKRMSSRIMLGSVLYHTGKKVEAIPYLVEAVKNAPNNAELAYLLAMCYQARNGSGDLDRAGLLLQAAVSFNDKHGAATLAIAKELERRKQYAAAGFAYRRAFQLGMEGPQLLLRSGNMMLKAEKNEEGWYRRGLYFEAIEKPELALKEYENLTKKHDSCRSGFMHIARAYTAMEKHEKALLYLRKAQKMAPARAKELDWTVIDALGQTKSDTERIGILKSIVAEGGKDGSEAMYQLAKISDGAGKSDEAEDWLRKCVAYDPKDSVFRTELGRLFLSQRGKPEKLKAATSELEEAVRLDPTNYNAVYGLGLAYLYADNIDQAILTLRHAVDIRPETGEAYQSLATAFNKANRKQEAAEAMELFKTYQSFNLTRDDLQARCKREPKNPRVQQRMAEFHIWAHEYNEAIVRYEKVLAIEPNNRQARSRIAEACGYMGRREDQKKHLALLAKAEDGKK